MTFYGVLGIPEDADSEAIHNAYRTRARQYHPDAGEGSSAGKFREIVEAYETLADPMRRQAYDRSLAGERRPVTPVDVLVEPLAQPWFSRSTRGMNQWPPVQRMRVPAIEDPIEQLFRACEELFSDPWFGR
jgi:curved DNA-binding protein CbpA